MTRILGLFFFCMLNLAAVAQITCEPWQPCDDGNPLTIVDKWDDDCNCVGSFIGYDVDNDGIYDYQDNCPYTPNTNQQDSDHDGIGDVCDPTPDCIVGAPCNDNNPITTNDIFDVNCNCAGIPIVPGCEPWQPCDDGNPLTIVDKWDDDCNCAGSFIGYDVDNDGIYDFEDNCPYTPNTNQQDSDNDGIGDVCDPFSNCIVGAPCNDFNPQTIDDKYDENCDCRGVQGPIGCQIFAPCDDGNPNTINDIYDVNCNCVGTPIPTCTVGGPCNDNNPLTINDIYDVNCNCVGTIVPDCEPWQPCDDGNPLTIVDKWDDDCNCAGSFIGYDVDNDGIYDYEDNCPYTPNPGQQDSDNDGIGDACDSTPTCTVGGPCNDNNPNTINDIYDVNCNCAGTPVPTCTVGGPCNDNNPNTINDIYDVNCNCAGTPVPTCTVGGPCNDNNPNTINDIYDVNCNCAGTPITPTDTDNDGIPDTTDNCPYLYNPDQADADGDGLGDVCDPLPYDCHQFFNYSGFEIGWNIWNDGGADSYRNYEPGIGGNASNWCIRLRDGEGQASSMFTNVLDLDGVTSLRVDFMFLASSYEPGEGFLLEYSIDGGNNYQLLRRWQVGVDFFNGVFYSETHIASVAFSDNTRLRFRSDGNTNLDAVFLDEVVISLCGYSGLVGEETGSASAVINDNGVEQTIELESNDSEEAPVTFETVTIQESEEVIRLYPNPVVDILNVSGLSSDHNYEIFSADGKRMTRTQSTSVIDVSNFEKGMYFLRMNSGETHRFIKY